MSVITWIGLGQMGLPMATNLVRAGHEVHGVEIDPEMAAAAAAAGIVMHDSAAESVPDSAFVFTMLPTGDLVAAVLTGEDGVFALMRDGAVAIDSSTVDVVQTRDLHDEAKRRGVAFLDAPVSGGVAGAQAGTLAVMVGGDAADFEVARPVLEGYGGHVGLIGGAGSGQAVKIVNNMIVGACLAATCEGVVLAERLGLDTSALFDMVSRSSGDNWALRNWYPIPGVVETAASNRDFAPGFTTALLVKDLNLAVSAGQATGTPLQTGQTVLRQFTEHKEAGNALLDCSSLITSIRDHVDR
ncbi:NAD(P)-dependent oxidoreductase [Gordonia humi]|uniref:3-hydroxyisobutyrate dehydrogenase n=1 Tax=Gordonia humi TaxID=686429 RepID=A0A840F246_9ACTN|nr:NAD(P)-dependent oxidoreductase [Gordonia humi]MBB4137961.1 3-hydroxyisobutyrate dehydrogenase [Gordonia humi]